MKWGKEWSRLILEIILNELQRVYVTENRIDEKLTLHIISILILHIYSEYVIQCLKQGYKICYLSLLDPPETTWIVIT